MSLVARKYLQAILGITLIGIGVAFNYTANLGLGPWGVFHDGISKTIDVTYGQAGILTSLITLLLWIPLKQKIGVVGNGFVGAAVKFGFSPSVGCDAEVRVYDGSNYDSVSFESWFVGNRRTITIQQDVNPEDGFDGGQKVSKEYEIYYLSGGPNSLAGTKYLFVGDSLNGQADIGLYRRALLASVNKLNEVLEDDNNVDKMFD